MKSLKLEQPLSNSYFIFIISSIVMFMGGFTYGLLDVMSRNLQHIFDLKQNGIIPSIYFGTFLIATLPIGLLLKNYCYRVAIMIGLVIFMSGTLLVIAAAVMLNFYLFVIGFFIVACGIITIDSNNNPMMINLGAAETSNLRINIGQAVAGIGVFIGPIIAGKLLLSLLDKEQLQNNLDNIILIYTVVTGMGFILFIMLWFVRIPKSPATSLDDLSKKQLFADKKLFEVRHFRLGLLAFIIYAFSTVGAISSFLYFSLDYWQGLTIEKSSYLLGIGFFIFMVGRIVSTILFKYFSANNILGYYSVAIVILAIITSLGIEVVSVLSTLAMFFFFSILYATIFGLAVDHLDSSKIKLASSLLVMASAGGSLAPFFYYYISHLTSYALSYLTLVPSFIFVAWYGFKSSKI